MHAPDGRQPIPLRYLGLGLSVIPLAPKEKKPYLQILEGGTWAPFQSRRPSEPEVQGWLDQGQEHNWGVVCGQVSGGLYCGDADDAPFSQWILDHARDPILRGACVVQSGSGKAHVWFRSPNKLFSGTWRVRNSGKMGDIRGDGNGTAGASYMVVPPSTHPDGGRYRYEARHLGEAPWIDNGEAFLTDVLNAYLSTHPERGVEAIASSNKDILILDDGEKARVYAEVRALGLKRKIYDTLMTPGKQAPGSQHWPLSTTPSGSDVDFAVCCELVRKGCSFEQVERIFATTEVGHNCYRDGGRSNHGYAYLLTTYNNAKREVEAERQASRLAEGHGFKVVNAVRRHIDRKTSMYILTLEYQRPDGGISTVTVEVADEDLHKLERFQVAVSKQVQWVPEFKPNQQGRQFLPTFGQAVMSMVSETITTPEAYTRLGPLAERTRSFLRRVPKGEPPDLEHMNRLGWQQDGVYYVDPFELVRMLRAEDHTLKNEDGQELMRMLGASEIRTHRWPDGLTSQILVLHPRGHVS